MIDDYSYEEQFADHYAANFIIVDKGATVTINAGIAPTVSGETFLITNEELQHETIKLNESLCSENNLVFGKMEASKLTFTFKDKNTYPTDLTETEIDVYLYFNGDSSSLFKVGTYTIDADKYSADRYTRSITAYDQIYYLKDVDITSWYNDYFGDGQRHAIGFAIVSLFNWIKDENDDYPDSPKIDIDIESGYNLTNALFTISKTIESDSISFEFFMQRLLEWNGAFGHINRNGNFEFKVMQWYDAEPVRTVTNDDRIPPTEFDIVSTWGIGGIDIYDADNIRKFSVRNTNKKKPSIYTIVDSFVVADRDAGDSDVDTALKKLHQVINHYNYKSCKATCTGDLCVEVGDRINVNFFAEETDPRDWFRSYVLERTFTGIQGMTDVYVSKGDKKQPVFTVTNDNWHNGSSSIGTSGAGTGGVSKVNSDIAENQYVEIVRNYGFRFLNEPEAICEYDEKNHKVKLKWEDPADLADSAPVSCTWAKTYVVRREGERAVNIYQGTLLKTSITRDEHKTSWFEDDTVQENKRYYYSIMPCDTKDDVRWTCCFSVNTFKFVDAPTIGAITQSDADVTVNYTIPSGTYSYIKLVYKKDTIPFDKDDGTAIDILQSSTSQVISGITDGSTYWFVIFTDKTSSEAVHIDTLDILRQVTVLLNDSNMVLDDVLNEANVVRFQSYPNSYVSEPGWKWDATNYKWWSGPANDANSAFCSKIGIIKGHATKMYIEASVNRATATHGNYEYFECALCKSVATSWKKPTAYKTVVGVAYYTHTNYTHTEPWYNLAKTTMEISLDNLDENDVFYIYFHLCDETANIYKVYFDDYVEVVRSS